METDPLTLEQAIDFIGRCKMNGTKLLGVERLFLENGSFVLDHVEIADFTMLPDTSGVRDADAAIAFIRNIATENSYFTVVADENI